MTDQQRLFFDDANDALRTVVQALGGSKPVACKLWPEKAPDAAGRYLADCLNPNKPEHLSVEQVLLLLRWGHDAGCHAGMTFIAAETGYEVTPISPEGERDRLADAILEGSRTLDRAIRAAQRIKAAA